MKALLSVWLGVSTGIGIAALALKAGPWHRAIPGALAWPMYPFLIAGSWVRYTLRRRGLEQ
jgi:hypothetical protein